MQEIIDLLSAHTKELCIDSKFTGYTGEKEDPFDDITKIRLYCSDAKVLFKTKEKALSWLINNVKNFFEAFDVSLDNKCRVIVHDAPVFIEYKHDLWRASLNFDMSLSDTNMLLKECDHERVVPIRKLNIEHALSMHPISILE